MAISHDAKFVRRNFTTLIELKAGRLLVGQGNTSERLSALNGYRPHHTGAMLLATLDQRS